MRYKFILVFVSLVASLITAGCSNDEEAVKEETENQNRSLEEPEVDEADEEVEFKNVENYLDKVILPKTREEMKLQEGGLLVRELTLEDELEINNEQFLTEIEGELTDQLKSITTETQDPFEVEKALSLLLGTSNYKEVLERAEAFQPDFEEPYLPYPGKAKENDDESITENGKAIILLDASSSMLLSVDGEVKMDIAKEAVMRFAEVIGQDNELSLVVYGHKGSESDSDKELSCNGIEEIYSMESYEAEAFEESLSTFDSKGWTPLAGAINKANDMSDGSNSPITLYIVSDGVETCDGDPVKAAEDFVHQNEHRSVNIIGFNVDQAAEEQLTKVSEAGNGEYFSASNADDLKQTIEYEWLPSAIDLAWAFTKAPGPWEILDEYNRYDVEHEHIKTIIQKERDRYDFAIKIIRDEAYIPRDQRDVLSDLISDRYSSRMDEWRNIRSDKINEIDSIAEEIRERVNEWTEEMKKRKRERGDVW